MTINTRDCKPSPRRTRWTASTNPDTGSAAEVGTTPGSDATGNVLTNDTDVDIGDTKTVVEVNGQLTNVGNILTGTYGSITLNGNGTYNYIVDNANAAVQALRLSTDTLSESFNYTVADAANAASTATLVITIGGANDAPVAITDAGSAVEAGTAPGSSRSDPPASP